MIPGGLGAELARVIGDAVATGELPAAAQQIPQDGTWRPASHYRYATSLPFQLAAVTVQSPMVQSPLAIAARLAEPLRAASWISDAQPTGEGYLTIAVTDQTLADLAVRITQSGPACATSTALRGVIRPAPPLPDLSTEPTWRQAWRDQAAALAGRLAQAAGAQPDIPPKRLPPPTPAPGGAESVASAVSYFGLDAVRYGLARIPASRQRDADAGVRVTNNLTDPCSAVLFARADAASTLRWATDLAVPRSAEPAGSLAGRLTAAAELTLLSRLSWLAERVAAAARHNRPADLPRYLETLALAWLDCRESCPALPFGGRAAPRDAAGIDARLWLAAGTVTALDAGLALIGVPDLAGHVSCQRASA